MAEIEPPNGRRYERAPDAIGLLALALVAGVVQLASGVYPEPVVHIAAGRWPVAWAVSLVLSSLVCLIGVAWPRPLFGRLMELAGRVGVVTTAAAYAVAFTVSGTLADAFAASFAFALAITSTGRVIQLGRRLRHWLTAIRRESVW